MSKRKTMDKKKFNNVLRDIYGISKGVTIVIMFVSCLHYLSTTIYTKPHLYLTISGFITASTWIWSWMHNDALHENDGVKNGS